MTKQRYRVLYLTRMAMRFPGQPYALQMEVRSMKSKVMDQVPINLQYQVGVGPFQ